MRMSKKQCGRFVSATVFSGRERLAEGMTRVVAEAADVAVAGGRFALDTSDQLRDYVEFKNFKNRKTLLAAVPVSLPLSRS